jgi:hypothetical protein
VEKPFGWMKQIGGLRKVKQRGLAKVEWLFVFTCAAYNLLRIPKLRARVRKECQPGTPAPAVRRRKPGPTAQIAVRHRRANRRRGVDRFLCAVFQKASRPVCCA